MNEIKIQHVGDRLVFEKRDGKLPDLPPAPLPQNYSFIGTLAAVFSFLEHRTTLIDKKVAIVSVDRKNLTIEAQTSPNLSLNDVVTGKIELNPDLKAFKINQVGPQFTRETLVGLLRTNRQFFPDKEAHGQLMSTIKNLKVNVNISAGRNEDNRGNKSQNLDKTVVADNVPVSTLIEIPVFVGERPIKLALDICYDTSESNVHFWFESPELNEIVFNESNGRLQQEIDRIQGLGYLVIEK